MNEDVITDLKQFIAATVTQQTSGLRTDLREDLRADIRESIDALRTEMYTLHNEVVTKIDDLSASVAQALDTSNEATAEQLQDHGTRITKLETQAA